MGKLLNNILLATIAIVLYVVLLPIAFGFGLIRSYSKQGVLIYLSDLLFNFAHGVDQLGNATHAELLNGIFKVRGGSKFGSVDETISSVLGKNERDGKLSKLGSIIVWILDKIDSGHSGNAIEDDEGIK